MKTQWWRYWGPSCGVVGRSRPLAASDLDLTLAVPNHHRCDRALVPVRASYRKTPPESKAGFEWKIRTFSLVAVNSPPSPGQRLRAIYLDLLNTSSSPHLRCRSGPENGGEKMQLVNKRTAACRCPIRLASGANKYGKMGESYLHSRWGTLRGQPIYGVWFLSCGRRNEQARGEEKHVVCRRTKQARCWQPGETGVPLHQL